jgi:hypothetical protein
MTDSTLFPLAEAAERTGLSVDALRQRIKRGKLAAVKGNDGLIRVRLTTADLASLRPDKPAGADQPATSQRLDNDQTIKALADAVAAFREAETRLAAERDAARAERDAAQAEVVAQRSRADRAEGEGAALRAAVDREAAARSAAEARAARDGARADLEAAARREAEAALARLQGRSLWRRIRNRP